MNKWFYKFSFAGANGNVISMDFLPLSYCCGIKVVFSCWKLLMVCLANLNGNQHLGMSC